MSTNTEERTPAELEGTVRKAIKQASKDETWQILAVGNEIVAIAEIERGPNNEPEICTVTIYQTNQNTGFLPGYIGRAIATIQRADTDNVTMARLAKGAVDAFETL